MDTFFPGILLAYLEPFRQVFISPSFETFKAYAWAMMVVKGSKRMTKNADNGFAVLFEAKVLSDISYQVSFDAMRNQIVRNIDVMLERNDALPKPLG